MENIEIIIGTYENLVLGYQIHEKPEGLTLETTFTTDSHRGALRTLAVSPQGILASSSTDDSIRLHHLKKRKEVGTLFQHDGSVNSIQFFRGGHMFSASEDGTICLWKCKNWELMRVLKGHRSHIMSVAVHPSAKLGLSIGSDRSFFTWDLTTGKLAFKRKTEEAVQNIMFTQDANCYILVYQKKIELYSLDDTSVIQTRMFDNRINSVCFVKDNIVAVACDNGELNIIDMISDKLLLSETFSGRLRCLSSLITNTWILLFIATSNGILRVCKLVLSEGSEKCEKLLEFESRSRVTCMTVYAPPEILEQEDERETSPVAEDKKKRRKRKRESSDGDCPDSSFEKDVSPF